VEEKKIAWVKWESVCLKKEKGGIGIMDLRKFNYALLGKWFHNKGELWARILDSKYGDWRNLEEATRGSRVSTWWKDINIIDRSGADGSVFDKGIKWKVGCGEKAKFWEDGWKEDGVPFKLKYPTLFSISKQQQHLIKMMGNFTATGWEWDFKWRRQLFDDEMEMAVKFLEDLEGISIHPDREDKWI